jgi:hypothetical protein
MTQCGLKKISGISPSALQAPIIEPARHPFRRIPEAGRNMFSAGTLCMQTVCGASTRRDVIGSYVSYENGCAVFAPHADITP